MMKPSPSPRPRRHDMRNWLHDHHMPPKSPGQHPPLPFQKHRHKEAQPQSHDREEIEGQAQQQRDASAYVAAFLRDAASSHHGEDEKVSMSVPIKVISQDNKNSSSKKQERLARKNYSSSGSVKSANSSFDCQSSPASIDNLSECLNEVARSRTQRGMNRTSKNITIQTISTKTSDEKRKGTDHDVSEDEMSFISVLSDWNDLVDKTFGDEPDVQHVREAGGKCSSSKGDGKVWNWNSESLSTSSSTASPTATLPRPTKPILKDAKGLAERADLHGNNSNKQTKMEKRRSLSMSNIYDAITTLFEDSDEELDRNSFEAETSVRERSNADRQERLKQKKAAEHTRALRRSLVQKADVASPGPPPPLSRSRNNSCDDADRFLRSLEESSASLHQAKTEETKFYSRQAPRSSKSLDAFDDMLAEMEEEERMMESAIFGSKSKSRERELLSNIQIERGMHPPSHDVAASSSSAGNTASNKANVICREWIDRRGMLGHYTGEVNSMMQPHGEGTLVYENGLVLDCHWRNGIPSVGVVEGNNGAKTQAQSQRKHAPAARQPLNCQLLSDYHLGMAARSPHDMKEEEPDKAIEGISRLKPLDFAFVRRSNKQWTYSVVSDCTDDCISFVVDEVGRTKRIDRAGWLKNIRLIRVQKQKYRDHQADAQEENKGRSRKEKQLEP